MDVVRNVPCSAVVDTKDLSLQVRGQNGLMFPKMGGSQWWKSRCLSLLLIAVEFYPTVSQNGDFIPDVYFNQGKNPTNVIELDAAVIALYWDR